MRKPGKSWKAIVCDNCGIKIGYYNPSKINAPQSAFCEKCSIELSKSSDKGPEVDEAELRILLDLFMVSDPWPLDGSSNKIMEAFLDRESKKRGYENWVVAYHEMLREAGAKIRE